MNPSLGVAPCSGEARRLARLISKGLPLEEDGAPPLPHQDWPTFEEMADQFRSPHAWVNPSRYDFAGFFHAAVEASELRDGLILLAGPQPLSAGSSVTVCCVGKGGSDDGCIFYAFLFQGCGFDVFIWIEDDLNRTRLVWRGSEDEYVRAEVLLRMFEGHTLAPSEVTVGPSNRWAGSRATSSRSISRPHALAAARVSDHPQQQIQPSPYRRCDLSPSLVLG